MISNTERHVSRRAFLVLAAMAVAGSACGPAAQAPATSGTAPAAAPPTTVAPAAGSATSAPASAAQTAAPASPAQTAAPAASGGAISGKIGIAEQSPTIKTFDPGLANSTQTAHFFWPVFDALTWISADGKLKPALAQSWKNVDPKTWEFTLGDFKFHNGRPVQAQDVVDSYARYRDPAKK